MERHSDMATEEKSPNQPMLQPNRLPAMKWDEVLAQAQAIYDRYGAPPYTKDNERTEVNYSGDVAVMVRPFANLAEPELAVLSDFVYYWLPYIDRSKKEGA